MPTASVFREGILDGQVALVTGGGTGLGTEISLALARAGCDVVIASRDPEHLKSTRDLLESTGRRALAHQCDVRDAAQVDGLFRRVEEEFGGLNVLVNNAAGNFLCEAAQLSPGGFRAVVEIDLIGSFLCARAAYPLLVKQRESIIVNITATLDYQGLPLQVHAGSAKAGVDAMTRHLASEWGPKGIRVVAVAPGPIGDTEGMRRLAGGREKEIATTVPLRRLGRREDIAQVVLFLCSQGASWITGTTVVVDGGQRLKASW